MAWGRVAPSPPAPGWLAWVFTTRFVTDGVIEEDGEIWDWEGHLVAQGRQLALVPRPTGKLPSGLRSSADQLAIGSCSRSDYRSAWSRSSTSGAAWRKRSMSAAVVDQLSETLIERWSSTPIAASTGEGSRPSEAHDEPECTDTPA